MTKFIKREIYIIEKRWKGREFPFPIATASSHLEALDVIFILQAEDKAKNDEAFYSFGQPKYHYERVD